MFLVGRNYVDLNLDVKSALAAGAHCKSQLLYFWDSKCRTHSSLHALSLTHLFQLSSCLFLNEISRVLLCVEQVSTTFWPIVSSVHTQSSKSLANIEAFYVFYSLFFSFLQFVLFYLCNQMKNTRTNKAVKFHFYMT